MSGEELERTRPQNGIIQKSAAKSAMDTLRALLTLDTEDITAIAKTAVQDDPKGLVVRGMSLFQRWNHDRFGPAFLGEIEDMRSKGKIREDFIETDAGVYSLREFFKMVDGEPDEARFQAFCALFMSANAPDAEDPTGVFDIQLMGIIGGLKAGKMHLLMALVKIRNGIRSVRDHRLSTSRSARSLGIVPTLSFEETLKHCWITA